MKMEIVYQETKDGERKLELWDSGRRICVCEGLERWSKMTIERMVDAYNGKGAGLNGEGRIA